MAADPRTIAQDVARDLARVLGQRLRGVVLYGSVARGEHVPEVSDINILVLIDDIDSAAIALAAPTAARMAEHSVNPLVLEWADRTRAADVFGIELLDMQDAHEVLHGANPFADLIVDRRALRLQAERELRSKLLGLHSGMLHALEAPELLGALLIGTLPAFVTHQRAVLRLTRQPVPGSMPGVIDAATALVGCDPAGMRAAHAARLAARPWKLSLSDPIVESYRAACERTAKYVDVLEGE
jgi:hypothetical protein